MGSSFSISYEQILSRTGTNLFTASRISYFPNIIISLINLLSIKQNINTLIDNILDFIFYVGYDKMINI